MVVLAVSMALKPVELTHFLRTLNPKIIQSPTSYIPSSRLSQSFELRRQG